MREKFKFCSSRILSKFYSSTHQDLECLTISQEKQRPILKSKYYHRNSGQQSFFVVCELGRFNKKNSTKHFQGVSIFSSVVS